jgi:hypothetical protein
MVRLLQWQCKWCKCALILSDMWNTEIFFFLFFHTTCRTSSFLRITGFLDFVHSLEFKLLEKTTFWKLGLFLSSGEWMETITLLGPLEGDHLNHWKKKPCSSYIVTDGQSASSSWCRGSWPDFNSLRLTVTFFLLHVGCPLWWGNGSVICSAITHWLE